MPNLKVPYKSQWDDDARGTKNDCGPTSVAMILNSYGLSVTTDEVFGRTGAGSGVISIQQLQQAISSYGFSSKYIKGSSPTELKRLIDNGIPVIALVHYGDLSSRQDKNYTDGHFLVVSGYHRDGYYTKDPDFWGTFRKDGEHNYLKAEFEQAWVNATKDGNPPNALLYIEPIEPSIPEDRKKALELLEKYRQEADHGNLEGAMRALLGAVEATKKLEAAESQLGLCQEKLHEVDEAIKKKVESAVESAIENNDAKWQKEVDSAKWEKFNEAKWPAHLITAFTKLFNTFKDKGGDKDGDKKIQS